MSSKRVEYFVGVLPEDRQLLLTFIEELNAGIVVEGEFDDPDGYYSFMLSGDVSTYDKFIDVDFIKSLENFWE
jgi:hypothetical protein